MHTYTLVILQNGEEVTLEVEAEVVRNEGASTVFYVEGSIVKMIPTGSVLTLEQNK